MFWVIFTFHYKNKLNRGKIGFRSDKILYYCILLNCNTTALQTFHLPCTNIHTRDSNPEPVWQSVSTNILQHTGQTLRWPNYKFRRRKITCNPYNVITRPADANDCQTDVKRVHQTYASEIVWKLVRSQGTDKLLNWLS